MGMKIFILLCSLFLNNQIYSQQRMSTYHYRDTKLILNNHNFHRYVIPQLKSMFNEYFFLLKKVLPLQDHPQNIILRTQEVRLSWNSFPKKCHYKLSIDCGPIIKSFYQQLKKLDLAILKTNKLIKLKQLIPDKIKAPATKISKLYSASSLYFLESLDKISVKTYRALHITEEMYINSQSQFLNGFQEYKELHSILNEIELLAEMSTTTLLHKEYREYFDLIWIHFFKVIDRYVIKQLNKKYLLKNLESLNTTWNTFHMHILKISKYFPKKLKGTIKVMHNRWNSILKVILPR